MKTSKILISTFVAAAAMNLPALAATTVTVGDYTQSFDSITTGTTVPTQQTPAWWITGSRVEVTASANAGANNAGVIILGTGTYSTDGGSATTATATQLFLQGWNQNAAIDVTSTLVLGANSGDNAAALRFGADGNYEVKVSGDMILGADAKIIGGGTHGVISGNISGNHVLTIANMNSAATFAMTGATDKTVSLSGLTISGTTTVNMNYKSASLGALNLSGTSAALSISGDSENSYSAASLAGTGTLMLGSGVTFTLDNSSSSAGTDQTFSGTLAGEGALKLVGGVQKLSDVSAAGAIVVAGGTLELGGTISLSSAIQVFDNGSVTVDSATIFELGNLTAGEGGLYTLISGADSVDGWSSLSKDSFTINGKRLVGRQTADFSTTGTVMISGAAANLVWNGGSSGTWDVVSSLSWTNAGSADKFYNDDNVTFDTANAEVTVSGTVAPESVTISKNTTFTGTSAVVSLSTPSKLTVSDGATLTLDSGVTLDLGSGGSMIGASTSPLALSGTGTVKYSFTSSATWGGGTDSGVYIADTFSGTVDYTGCLNWSSTTSFGGSGATVKFSARDGHTDDALWGNSALTISNDVEFLTDYGINLGGSNLTLNGNVRAEDGTTLTITGGNILTFGGAANIGALTLSSTTLSDGSQTSCTVVFAGSNADIGSIEFNGNGGTVRFSKAAGADSATYNVGAISTESNNNNDNFTRNLTVDEGVTVRATSLTNNWGMGALTVDGVLELRSAESDSVNGTLTFATGGNNSTTNNVITGTGTIRTGKFVVGNIGKYNVAVNRLEIGSGGIETGSNSNDVLNLGKTTIAAVESWSASVSHGMALTSLEGTTFELASADGAGTTATLSGVLSGDGKLIKTGAGTLTLSGTADNTFTGGVEIAQGVVEAEKAAALGTGPVKIDGGHLSVADGVELSLSSITVVLGSEYDRANADSSAAIGGAETGTLSLASGAKITLTKSAEEAAAALAAETSTATFAYKIFEEGTTLATSADTTWFTLGEGWNDGSWDYTYANGILTLSMIPEPSAFGLLAGLGAFALVASRRRRNKR